MSILKDAIETAIEGGMNEEQILDVVTKTLASIKEDQKYENAVVGAVSALRRLHQGSLDPDQTLRFIEKFLAHSSTPFWEGWGDIKHKVGAERVRLSK